MQPKIKKLKVLTIDSIIDIGKSLKEEKSYKSHNKEIGRTNGSRFYHLSVGTTTNPNLKTITELTKALTEIVEERYPKFRDKYKHLYLYNPKDWSYVWDEYGCEIGEFYDFAEDYDMKVSTVYMFISGRSKSPPRLDTIKIVSAFFLMHEQSYRYAEQYKIAKPVVKNTAGAKLQLRYLREQKFWKDNNGTKN